MQLEKLFMSIAQVCETSYVAKLSTWHKEFIQISNHSLHQQGCFF